MVERECSEEGPYGSICADDMVSPIYAQAEQESHILGTSGHGKDCANNCGMTLEFAFSDNF
jgi:hypothetical protein